MLTQLMNEQLLSDRYKIINVLGAGGMGQTYVAEDTQRPGNPKCVVKQLKPASDDPNFLVTARRLFTGEAEMLEKLGHHDQIPRLLAHFERNEEFYVVQEFIDGQPLSAELPLGERWSESQVVALLKDVLGILDFIHAQGVIHRDIKPDNIIRRKQDGKLVLIDFGAVKQVRMQQTTAVGQVSITVGIGTPGYMPTEQSSGKPRPSSDIYALGMVSIQALTGLLPSQLREDEDGEAIWREQAEVSDGLATVLTTMTRHYFKHRYQSASEVLQALQALQALESPHLAANRGYTPTQAANNGGYTPTGVASVGHTPTQTNPNELTGFTQSGQLRTQPTQNEQLPTLNQQRQPTAPQHELIRSSSSNKLLLTGACFLSVLVAGGLFYFNSTNQKVVEKPPISPATPSLLASPSSSPNPRSTPSSQASPSSSPNTVASPPLPAQLTPPNLVKPSQSSPTRSAPTQSNPIRSTQTAPPSQPAPTQQDSIQVRHVNVVSGRDYTEIADRAAPNTTLRYLVTVKRDQLFEASLVSGDVTIRIRELDGTYNDGSVGISTRAYMDGDFQVDVTATKPTDFALKFRVDLCTENGCPLL